MTAALRILQETTTGYSIFEKDQVLTERQLNSVTDYLNDQTRLTRLYLLGVGVVSGLRVSLLSSNVTKVTPGIGITTDGDLLYYSNQTVIGVKTNGDLLYYSNDTVFDRFLQYDTSYPKYAPFYDQKDMIPVYELIPKDAEEKRRPIFPLSEFTTQTKKELKNMVAVLLMESYVNDPDICTATDCDNLGQDCINTIKLLLVEEKSINPFLKPAITTPNDAYSLLSPIDADRPQLLSSLQSIKDLYLDVCLNIHDKLMGEFVKIYPNCQGFISDIFLLDPIAYWGQRLAGFRETFAADSSGSIQYYYDFLKDLVETYNLFRDLLFGDNTCCCPDINWFPKHLLLGNLVPSSDSNKNRTTFYPSPTISQTVESLNHAKFLARKLDTLIRTFQVPAASTNAPIRITPSLFEDQSLEERAIPYYYQVNEPNPIHKSWNYRRHQRGMDDYNYSYNASESQAEGKYEAKGGASKPFEYQIGQFSFFRIEGHLGKDVKTVIAEIEKAIKDNNLPFTVRSLMLSNIFTDFISQNPAVEHFAGVVRGGTFVLVYDSSNMIVADFMLPYYCKDKEAVPEEPEIELITYVLLNLRDDLSGYLILEKLYELATGWNFSDPAKVAEIKKKMSPEQRQKLDKFLVDFNKWKQVRR